MAYLAVNKNGEEAIYHDLPYRVSDSYWIYEIGVYEDHMDTYSADGWIGLPPGTIEKITGKKLTWENEPVELK